jgi:hypothetical protein
MMYRDDSNTSFIGHLERLCFLADKEVSMARRYEKTMAGRIFENVLFLEEVFGDKADADIPDVPLLELAKSFDLSHPRTLRANRGRGKSFAAWKYCR